MARPRLKRPCICCGIRPDNLAGIQVAAVRIYRAYRQGARPSEASITAGLCAKCLAEAARDGRVRSATAMQRAVSA